MAKEIEIKLLLDAQALKALEASPALHKMTQGPATGQELRTVYFDTPDMAMRGAGVAVRLRYPGGRCLQSVKMALAEQDSVFIREEWEEFIPGDTPDLSLIDDPVFKKAVPADLRAKKLAPVFETSVRRIKRLLKLSNGAEIWMDLDVGAIRAGAKQEPIREVEFEVKSGKLEDLFSVVDILSKQVAMSPSMVSKADRGYRLARNQAGRPFKDNSR